MKSAPTRKFGRSFVVLDTVHGKPRPSQVHAPYAFRAAIHCYRELHVFGFYVSQTFLGASFAAEKCQMQLNLHATMHRQTPTGCLIESSHGSLTSQNTYAVWASRMFAGVLSHTRNL